MIEQKLRYMYEMAADGCDPEFNRTLLEAANEIARLRAALEPFAEVAKRWGWADLPDDSMELNEHVIEAPADDIAPGAAYCLHVSVFRNAASALPPQQAQGDPK